MKKLFIGLLTALTAVIFLKQPAQALDKTYMAGASAVLRNEIIVKEDCRKQKLEAFLASYNSPLAGFAQELIDTADKYGLDWRLIPAITGVESTFGRQIPYNSYNAYGWANGAYKFTSWEQSIGIVAKTLKEKYFDRGLDTTAKIGRVYAPPSKTWANKVNYFMEKIDSFEINGCLELLALTI